MRTRGWIWILALALMAGFAGWRFSRGGAIETDLLAMLPTTEQNPVAETALRTLASATGDRAVFLVRAGSPERSKAAALHLGASLSRSGTFGEVQTTLPPIDPGAVLRFYLPYRFRLTGPEGPPASAAALAARIETRLASPQSGMAGIGAAQDPLGDLEKFMMGLPLGAMRMELQDDLLVIKSPEALHVLISGSLKGSAFDPAVQKQVMPAVRAAQKELLQAFPEAQVLRTGALFYAVDARETAEWETNLISSCSMLCIVALYLWSFRSLRHLLLGVSCVAAGFIAAASVCLLVFGKLYLLTLVCGASVMGVAVDYSFLYFANQLGSEGRWDAKAVLERILPALTLGLATTLLGYAALLVAPFPGMRQIAVFSLVGLVGSFLTVLCILPDLLTRPLPPRPRLMAAMARLLQWAIGLARHRRTPLLLGLATLLLVAASTRVRVNDDVRELIQPSRSLQVEEAQIRALTGLSNAGAFFLVEGKDEAQLLEREEALQERLAPLVAAGRLEGFQAISAFVPSPARQDAHLRGNREQAPALAQALAAVGFKPEIGPGLSAEMAASLSQPLTVAQWFQLPLAIPYRMLWLGATPHGLASVVYPQGDPDGDRLRQAVTGLPGVTYVDKARSVTQLLAHYRRIATWALGGAILLVAAVLAWIYGPRPGAATLAPALFGILLALAGIGLTATPLTLFSTLALILVLGFGVDYAVFLKEGGHEDPSGLLGVLLASLATLVSYGLLVFSHTPALRGFALTLTLGVAGSMAVSFLALGPKSGARP